MLIRELILENFMSYEYARIPFKSGINVVVGPNGSGKSSMLLGISVALGQSHTERSQKLSDLIRRGKDQGRVTLVLDNSIKNGRRLIPRIRKDNIYLTRILRRDGKYWFEIGNRAATRAEVTRLLSHLGIDPENMLIIMHQNMVEEFTVLSPQDKLLMVEAAVGFQSYRENVIKAQRKLNRISSQEESVNQLLESAKQTLTYWRDQHDRYQQKKQLQLKRRFLEREFAWARFFEREQLINDLKLKMQKKEFEIRQLQEKIHALASQQSTLEKTLRTLKSSWQTFLDERLRLENEKAKHESVVSLSSQTLGEMIKWTTAHHQELEKCQAELERLGEVVQNLKISNPLESNIAHMKSIYSDFSKKWQLRFTLKNRSLTKLVKEHTSHLTKFEDQIGKVDEKTNDLDAQMESTISEIVKTRIDLALLGYQQNNASNALTKLGKELKSALADLDELRRKALEIGPQVTPTKDIMAVLDDIRVTDGHLAAFADVAENVEHMYESYSSMYLELKEKALLVSENREQALEEVRKRTETWRHVLQEIITHVNKRYQETLIAAQAIGKVQLLNEYDIESAGLVIHVGFKGGAIVDLNVHTQSGGERSTAIMAFLLALQQHMQSPFRAVDEYDIHMDPKNRETIANLLISTVKDSNTQYLAITPSRVNFPDENVHMITVQSIEGTSLVQEMM